MYLEEIEVQFWRGIRHQEFKLRPGLNVIHGPNESGKSSLRQAIRAAFLQNPTSKSKEALAARNWMTKTPPIVRVDFQLDGARWSVEKIFGGKAGSRLRKDGAVVAADSAVHDGLEKLLNEGVWLGSLWSEQGDMSLVDVPRALRGKLVAEEVVSPGLLWLEEQLQRQEGDYWTPTGRPKKLLQDARTKAMAAEDAVDESLQELEVTNAISEATSDLHEELQQTRAEELELSHKLEEMRHKVGAWDRHRAALAEWKTRVEATLRDTEWLQRWDRGAALVVAKWKDRQTYQQRMTALQTQMGQEPSREPIEQARIKSDYLRLLEQSKLREQLAKLSPPTSPQLATLRRLENDIVRSEASLESVAMKLSLTALSALKPTIQVDDKDRSSSPLSSGQTVKWDVHSQAKLVLSGVAEVTLEGGASDAAELAETLDEQRGDRQALLDLLGCKTAEEAQERADQARILAASIEGKPPSDAELEKLAKALPSQGAAYAKWSPEKLREQARSLRSDSEELEAQWAAAQRAFQKQRADYESLLKANPQSALELHLEGLKGELERWPLEKGAPKVPKIEKITQEWIGALEVGAPLATLRSKLEAQAAKLDKEKSGLRAPEGDEITEEAIEAVLLRQQSLAQERERLISRLNQDLGRLRERSDQFRSLVQRREEHAALQHENRRAELEAAAIQLLMTTFRETRSQLQNDLVGPLQDRVAQRLARITSGRYRGLQLDGQLSPTAVVPREIDNASLDDLSFGTREQLLFLTRLSLAEMLSEKHQRQSLIFDDNLVHTDEARMRVALEMLTEAAESSQIIVLTCHPERYRGLAQAQMLGFSP